MRPTPRKAIAALACVVALGAGCDAILGIPGQLDPLPGAGGAGGGAPGGLVLREGRLATQPGGPLTAAGSPALRVTNGAFEAAGACAMIDGEDVCVRGGLTAAGTLDP